MFNLGVTEMAVIAGLALILIGPKQLPEVARTVGRLLNELRRSAGSFTEDLKSQVNIDQRKIFDMEKKEAQVDPATDSAHEDKVEENKT